MMTLALAQNYPDFDLDGKVPDKTNNENVTAKKQTIKLVLLFSFKLMQPPSSSQGKSFD